MHSNTSSDSLFDCANEVLEASDVDQKLRLTYRCSEAWRSGDLTLDSSAPVRAIAEPGRPNKPPLVPASEVPKRGLGTEEGRAAMLHAVTHIEFNAINLAWDAVYRFRDLPRRYYADWVRVANEEAQHFELLRNRLRDMNYNYGDFPAHNGLWDMAQRTAFDPMVRMALVPRVLEARGLDVTPGIMARLKQVGDDRSVAALKIILREEVGHVAIGSHWFSYFCHQRGLVMEDTFRDLIQQYFAGELRGTFNYEARLQAGFSEAELAALTQPRDGA